MTSRRGGRSGAAKTATIKKPRAPRAPKATGSSSSSRKPRTTSTNARSSHHSKDSKAANGAAAPPAVVAKREEPRTVIRNSKPTSVTFVPHNPYERQPPQTQQPTTVTLQSNYEHQKAAVASAFLQFASSGFSYAWSEHNQRPCAVAVRANNGHQNLQDLRLGKAPPRVAMDFKASHQLLKPMVTPIETASRFFAAPLQPPPPLQYDRSAQSVHQLMQQQQQRASAAPLQPLLPATTSSSSSSTSSTTTSSTTTSRHNRAMKGTANSYTYNSNNNCNTNLSNQSSTAPALTTIDMSDDLNDDDLCMLFDDSLLHSSSSHSKAPPPQQAHQHSPFTSAKNFMSANNSSTHASTTTTTTTAAAVQSSSSTASSVRPISSGSTTISMVDPFDDGFDDSTITLALEMFDSNRSNGTANSHSKVNNSGGSGSTSLSKPAGATMPMPNVLHGVCDCFTHQSKSQQVQGAMRLRLTSVCGCRNPKCN
jgi:hypothetical protein